MSALGPLDKKLIRDLWRVRGQAAAIALVIACSVAIMVMSFGAMRSLSETRDAYYERYRFAHVFAAAKRAPLNLLARVAQLPGVAGAEGRIVHYATLFIPGVEEPAIGQLVSLPRGDYARTNEIVLRVGRRPARGSSEIVVSENLALAHDYSPGDGMSATINGRQRTLTIVGVALSPEFIYVLGPGQLVPDDRTFGILWMDRETLESAYDLKGAFNYLSVVLARNASEKEVIRRVDTLLEPYGGTGAHGRADQLSHAFIEQELNQLWVVAMVLPPIFLLVAAFLIHMILSRMIDLEREEIGLLKAFGYSNAAVGWHYLKFALGIAFMGVLLGSAAGLWLGLRMTELYGNYYRFPFLFFRTDPAIWSLAAGVALAAPLAGTWNAVKKAVRLAPAVAMVPAPPTIYRQTFVERLRLDRFISEPTHIIVRHLQRWPLRSGLTALGVALSGALLIGSLFTFDSIDEIIENFYFRDNRQDATLDFFEPRSTNAIYEIAHWPGVRLAEPQRQVPVRLRSGHLSERVAIYGVSQDATLKRFVDAEGQSFRIPTQGVVLSEKLADLLSVRPGNRVTIEILEGARRKADVPVASIMAELIGLSAYMDMGALNRLSGEGPAFTGARLTLDSSERAGFFAAIKAAPATGMVMLREPAIRAFRALLAENLYIVISFYAAFGAVVAFGVVYNTARIGLSERGRELASLRVLGFTKGEVAYILVGELAILVLVALPAAGLLGYLLAWTMSSAMETKLFRVPLLIEKSTYGFAALVMLASAAVSLAAVARRVARFDLVAVLKARE